MRKREARAPPPVLPNWPIFPFAKHHGRADAFLIAAYGHASYDDAPMTPVRRDDPLCERLSERVSPNALVLVTPPPSAAPRAVPARPRWRRPSPEPSFSDSDADDSSVEAWARPRSVPSGTGTEDDPIIIDP